MFDIIAFDADDTLWHNETHYARTEEKYRKLLSGYRSGEVVDRTLYETEMRNIPTFGYGIKSFTLSMIETALALTEGRVQSGEIAAILDLGKAMLTAPVELIDRVEDTLATLAQSHPLMVITKGDLLDQQRKIARSGLADWFAHFEVVSTKTPESYGALLAKHGLDAERFLMVGNSPRSDVLPVVEIGGWAVHIPFEITWAHEVVDDALCAPPAEGRDGELERCWELEHIGQLPALVAQLSREGT